MVEKIDTATIEMVEQKLSEITDEKVIVLLKPMPYEEIQNIKAYLSQRNDIIPITIGEEGKDRRILLKKYSSEEISEGIKNVIDDACAAYDKLDYKTSIEKLLKVVVCLHNPSAYIYKKLAFAYIGLGMYKEAIFYLRITEYVSQYEEKVLDFSNLIKKLKNNKVNKKEKNTHYGSLKNDFDFINLENLEEIAIEIYFNKGNVDVACQNFDISQEQILLIKILCARVYYQDNNFVKGDLLLRQIEKTKDKSQRVISLYQETMKNKFFYKNREDDKGKKLAVILQNKVVYE